MPALPRLVAVLVLAALAGFAAMRAFAADDVTIYRCIDSKGHLTLRDTPCAAGEKQEARTMVRPRDAAPRPPQATPVHDAAPPTYEAPRTTVVYPPRPLYECITPDNVSYTSDTSDGNPRWVPAWTLGYPVYAYPGQHAGVGFNVHNDHIAISGNTQYVRGPVLSAAASGAGLYVRDTCYELPQAEVCEQVRDRRDEIRRRFFNAMPSERDVLRVEERGLNARLAADCSG